MKKWKKVPEELKTYIEGIVKDYPSQKKIMFGCPAYFINGNMFTGLHQDSLIIRLSETDRQEIAAVSDEIIPFEPMPGRFMKEYVVITEHLQNDMQFMHTWMSKSYNYVKSMPEKKKKPSEKKSGQ